MMNNQILRLDNGDFEVVHNPPMPMGQKERIKDLERRVDILVRKIARMEAERFGE